MRLALSLCVLQAKKLSTIGADVVLPKGEKFLLDLSSISHLSLRLDAWVFMKQAPARLSGLRVQVSPRDPCKDG